MRDIKYVVTGVDRDNKRFSMQYSDIRYAMGINLWRGNVWEVIDGKRRRIKSVCN